MEKIVNGTLFIQQGECMVQWFNNGKKKTFFVSPYTFFKMIQIDVVVIFLNIIILIFE